MINFFAFFSFYILQPAKIFWQSFRVALNLFKFAVCSFLFGRPYEIGFLYSLMREIDTEKKRIKISLINIHISLEINDHKLCVCWWVCVSNFPKRKNIVWLLPQGTKENEARKKHISITSKKKIEPDPGISILWELWRILLCMICVYFAEILRFILFVWGEKFWRTETVLTGLVLLCHFVCLPIEFDIT